MPYSDAWRSSWLALRPVLAIPFPGIAKQTNDATSTEKHGSLPSEVIHKTVSVARAWGDRGVHLGPVLAIPLPSILYARKHRTTTEKNDTLADPVATGVKVVAAF